MILGKTLPDHAFRTLALFSPLIVPPAKFNIDEGADNGASQKFLAKQKVCMKYEPLKRIDLILITRKNSSAYN